MPSDLRLHAEPLRFNCTCDFDGRDRAVRPARLKVMQPRQPTFPVDDPQLSEAWLKAVTRPPLVRIEVLIVRPQRHHPNSLPSRRNRARPHIQAVPGPLRSAGCEAEP